MTQQTPDQDERRVDPAAVTTSPDDAGSSAADVPEAAVASGRRWLPRARRARIAAACVVALVLVSGTGLVWLQSGRSILGTHAGEGVLAFLPDWLPDDVAFRYPGRDVTVYELNQHVEMLRALYGIEPRAKAQLRDTFRRDAAKSYAVSLELDRAARDAGITIADKQARDALGKIVAEKLGEGPQAYPEFIRTLADKGTSEQVVLQEVKRRLAMGRLFNQVVADVGEVTDAQVEAAFEKRRGSLGTPQLRRIANIVVRTEDAAKSVVTDVRSGTAFADAARAHSLDASTKDDGGDLGELNKEQLEPGYGDAAFAAAKGAVFGPVRTQHGWNVGLVRAVIPSQPAEFAAVADDLRQALQDEAYLQRWRSWLKGMITSAGVRYAEEYRPADPDAPPDVTPDRPGAPTEPPR